MNWGQYFAWPVCTTSSRHGALRLCFYVSVHLGNCQTNGDGRWNERGELIYPRAHYWLLITAFSPETPSAFSFTYLRLSRSPLPFPTLHYWFTARGGSSSPATLVTNQGLQWAHPFSLCSFTTGLALLLLQLLWSALIYVPRQAEPFLNTASFSAISPISRQFLDPCLGFFLVCIFWSTLGCRWNQFFPHAS